MTTTVAVADWRDRVEQAATIGDQSALRELYAEAVLLFGEHASVEWAEALSAFDASAQTG